MYNLLFLEFVDGACWWCKLVQRVGYSICLNAGTVLWYRHPGTLQTSVFVLNVVIYLTSKCLPPTVSQRILQEGWDASMDPELEGNPIKR